MIAEHEEAKIVIKLTLPEAKRIKDALDQVSVKDMNTFFGVANVGKDFQNMWFALNEKI